MLKLPPLQAVQTFEAASRLSSFLRAAQELGVTPSAVSHRIRSLERELGVQLFHRVHRSVALTDAGRRYAEEVTAALRRIEAATQSLARQGKSDILTVHVVPSLATQWLMPRLARFSALHPDIDLRLNASHEPVDLTSGAVDFDIRYGTRLQASGTVTEDFPEETIVVLCAPELVRGVRAIHGPADLRKHTLIHSELNLFGWRDWAAQHPGLALDLERGPRFDRSFMAISAAVDGLGVCLESRLLVQQELARGLLVMPLGPGGPRVRSHHLNYLRSRAGLPKLALFRRWLTEELDRSAAPENRSKV